MNGEIETRKSWVAKSPPENKHMTINIEDLQKVEIRMGKILSAEKVEGSEKLLRLKVDLGEENPRNILSGVAKAIPDPSTIVGKMVPIVANLESRKMMGEESQGMMLCAIADGDSPVLLLPEREVPPGDLVR